ncbi:hypothetical protein B7Z00_00275 [Candidatus Saccharibacteria bacterium 32-50-10]|nr:MAG: hypothetical protein B7Z00_00275 [Candidatus Saccharibacteria bacterium 32-50-10]
MNPELPQVRPSTEQMPQIPGGIEYFPDGTARTPEKMPNPERPSSVEQMPRASHTVPTIAAPNVALPQVPAPSDTSAPANSPVVDLPAIAADDDLIEKEWVDKAKKVIALTKGNPYEQARAIAALQADYLKKRHNREIGESNEHRGN